MSELDRVIHEPARLTIIVLLSSVKEADFLYLLRETRLTKGNLSTHLVRLEEAGYVNIEKTFRGKIPLTLVRLTSEGRAAFQRGALQFNCRRNARTGCARRPGQ
jgi:DNA-binding MarR family transcriptional regulator